MAQRFTVAVRNCPGTPPCLSPSLLDTLGYRRQRFARGRRHRRGNVVESTARVAVKGSARGAPTDAHPARVVVAVQQRMMAEVMAHRLGRETDVDVGEILWSHDDVAPSVTRSQPDVVLLDLRLIDGEVSTICDEIHRADPAAHLAI